MKRLTDAELMVIVNRHRQHCMACSIDDFCPDAVLAVARAVQDTVVARSDEQVVPMVRLRDLYDC